MMIYCCQCGGYVEACLEWGATIYPHRSDLSDLFFYRCPNCGCYTGCHKGTKNPMGVIPTKEMRVARKKIHSLIDPFWKSGIIKRGFLYKKIAEALGVKQFHTGWTKSLDECKRVYACCQDVLDNLNLTKK